MLKHITGQTIFQIIVLLVIIIVIIVFPFLARDFFRFNILISIQNTLEISWKWGLIFFLLFLKPF